MKAATEYLWFETQRQRDYINITDQVERIVADSGIQEGMVLVSAMHITAGVYVNDAESGIIQDGFPIGEGACGHDGVNCAERSQRDVISH